MPESAAVAAYRRALERAGKLVTFRRVSGSAPHTATFDAKVRAVLPQFGDTAPIGAFAKEGELTRNDRHIVVLARDLADKFFPLPLKKNDKVSIDGTQWLNIKSVDSGKRQFAGAIEVVAEGV
jgi:hypothetical protein